METLQRPYKHFDLSTKFFERDEHWAPTRTHDEDEAARRRSLARGSLVLEQQQFGLGMISSMIKLAQSPEDIRFLVKIMSACGLNTSRYTFGPEQDQEVMRRVLKLPDLTITNLEYPRVTTTELLDESAFLFGEAMALSGQAVDALQINHNRYNRIKKSAARVTGRASLLLACAPLADQIIESGGVTNFDAQYLARQRALGAVGTSRELAETIGVYPSAAQLANPYSNVSAFIHNQAPGNVVQAFDQAYQVRAAA